MILHESKNYTIEKVYIKDENNSYYALFYKRIEMPDQSGLILKESGIDGITTVTVTFEV